MNMDMDMNTYKDTVLDMENAHVKVHVNDRNRYRHEMDHVWYQPMYVTTPVIISMCVFKFMYKLSGLGHGHEYGHINGQNTYLYRHSCQHEHEHKRARTRTWTLTTITNI
jgi:hypothetical protein